MRISQKNILLLAAMFFALPAAAQEVPVSDAAAAPVAAVSSTNEAVAPQPEMPAPMTILQAVKKARALLKQDIADRTAANPTPAILKAKPQVADVTLAVWDKAASTVTLVHAEKSGTSLKVKTPGDWPIRVTTNNAQYSVYALPAARGALVLGSRYPVAIEHKAGKKKTYELHDTAYIPYQTALYSPEVLTAGSDYLSYLIQGAFDELRAKGVTSRAFPSRLVVDVIDPYLIKSIVVIEHSDHATLLGDDAPERALGRFLVNLALNEEDAFDSSLSTAGAAGLVQFIPSTYKLYAQRRADLGLIQDFRAGMADHKNAIKAEVAYLDQSLAGMPEAIKSIYASDKDRAAEFLAAAYNGGDSRVKKAFAVYGDDWAHSPKAELTALNARAATLKTRIAMFKSRIKRGKYVTENKASLKEAESERAVVTSRIALINSSSLRQETAIYVAKLRKTYALLSAGAFATPAAPSGALPVAVASSPAAPSTIAFAQ